MGNEMNIAEGQNGESEGEVTTYRAYRRRFGIALTLILFNVCDAGMIFNLASVSYKAADYFEVTLSQINWFTEVCLILPLVLSFVSMYVFKKFGMKVGLHIGAAFSCVGAVTRAIATSGLIAGASTQYVVSLTGQVVMAVGSPCITFSSTKLAQNWFPDKERMLATTVMTSSSTFGISLAQIVSPLVVKEPQQIPTLNYLYGGLAVISELFALAFVTRARPPTPPSRSAEKGIAEQAPFLLQVRRTLTCLPFLGILFMNGIIMAVFISFSTLTQQMLCSMGYSELFSGTTVTVLIYAGLAGSLIIVVVANRTKALTLTLKIAFAVGIVCGILMMEMYLIPSQHALLIVGASLFGFFCNGVFPLSLEMGVETTYPVEETISTTLMFVTGQILAVIMTNAVVHFSGDLPQSLEGVEVCTDNITSDLEARDYSAPLTGVMVVMSIIVVLFVPLFRTPYKRQEAESHIAATAP